MLKPDGSYDLKVRGISNFLSILSLDKLLEQIPGSAKVTIDLSESRLVGFTVMEHLYEFQKLHQNTGGEVEHSRSRIAYFHEQTQICTEI